MWGVQLNVKNVINLVKIAHNAEKENLGWINFLLVSACQDTTTIHKKLTVKNAHLSAKLGKITT